MGRYWAQYVYRCPRATCRNREVEPGFLPAAAAIDWTLPGTRIGDRTRPLAEKTRSRIAAGIERFARPFTVEVAGDTFERVPASVRGRWMARSRRCTPRGRCPMLVPLEGRDGKVAAGVGGPMRTQTARSEAGLIVPPMLVPMGGPGTTTTPRPRAR